MKNSLFQKIEDYIINQLPDGEKEVMVVLSREDHLEFKEEIIHYASLNRAEASKTWDIAYVFSIAMFQKTIHIQVGRVSCIGVMTKL